MIHATPLPDPELRHDLLELDELTRRLGTEAGRSLPWDGTIRRHARYQSVTSSTSIEGFEVDPDDGAALVAGEVQPGAGDPEDRWAVACYARAMDHVAVMSDDPVFRWLDRVLLDLHFDACTFQRTKSPGRWRTGGVHISDGNGRTVYSAPDADDVPRLMGEIVDWLERGDLDAHAVVRAAMAHLHVVSIHPWRDGNGRVSRIAQSLVLAREGLLSPELGSIEPWLARHTPEYYAQLQAAHGATYEPDRSALEWVRFCVRAHLDQAQERLDLFARAGRRWSTFEHHVAARGWPDRLVIALEQAWFDGTNPTRYREEADISAGTAAGDLTRLVDVGLVERRGRGPATTYHPTEQLRELVGDE